MESKQAEAQANEKLLHPSQVDLAPYPPSNQPMPNPPPAYAPATAYPVATATAYPAAPVAASYPDGTVGAPMYTTHVVVDQPRAVVYSPEGAEKVPDYLCCSILTTLCCCLCLGIAAIVTSSQANSMRHVDPRLAAEKARTARNLNIAGVICGIVITAAYVALRFALSTNYY